MVSLMFVLTPVLWRVEKHHRRAEARHVETMEAHRKTHEHLGLK
jgi:hypothetical protein